MSTSTRRGIRALAAVIVLTVRGAAAAEDLPQATSELVAEVRETLALPQGQSVVRYKPAGAIVQGQTVFYTVRIHNPTPVALRDVVTVQRVPANTSYVMGSAAGPAVDVSFSADGGVSFASEEQLRIADSTGTERKPLAAAYTHIRWRLRNALAPGATALARFQAIFR